MTAVEALASLPLHKMLCTAHGAFDAVFVDEPCPRCAEIELWREEKEDRIRSLKSIESELFLLVQAIESPHVVGILKVALRMVASVRTQFERLLLTCEPVGRTVAA